MDWISLSERWIQLEPVRMIIDHVIAGWFVVPACDFLHRCVGGVLLVVARQSSLPSVSQSTLRDSTRPPSLATMSISSVHSSTCGWTSLLTASLSTKSAGSSTTSPGSTSLSLWASFSYRRLLQALDTPPAISFRSSRKGALPSVSTQQFGDDDWTKEGQKVRPSSRSGNLGCVCIVGESLWSMARSNRGQDGVTSVRASECSEVFNKCSLTLVTA